MTRETAVIRQGEVYDDGRGMRVSAACDGLLVRIGNEAMIVPDARLVGAINQLGTYRVKPRKGHATLPGS